jgi:hypothetical protein
MNAKNSLLKQIGAFDAFDYADEQLSHIPQISKQLATPTELKGQAGMPMFVGQFDLSLISRYYTLTGGAYASIPPASLNAALQNNLPFFIFGNNDFAAGYNYLRGQYPINANWSYGSPFVWTGQATELGLDATVFADLQIGDIVLPFTSALPGAGTTTLALHIIRSGNVAYASILTSSNSDRFIIDGIRYNLSDNTQIAQFANQFGLFDLSLFGKAKTDRFSPTSYIRPEQFQANIADLPIEYAIDKHKSFAVQNIFTNLEMTLSIFVVAISKIEA